MEEKKEQKKKRRFRWWHLCYIFAALLAIWWFNNYTIRVNKNAYVTEKVTTRFRIVVISDLHIHEGGIGGDKVLSKISAADPDMVFVLGDMYTTGSEQQVIDMAAKAVTDIAAEGYPTYFVSGEHDTDKGYIAALESAGVNVMNYRSDIIEVKGNRVQLIGIDNVYYSPTFDLSNEFTVDDGCLSILLAHIPNYPAFSEFGTDLTICADTHGGMFQLPFDLGPLVDPDNTDRWFPQILTDATVFDKGWFQYVGGAMFITSGLGDSPYPVRFNNRPEVVVLDILPEKEES
ncbi:MAG: metallophosphoesterase [Ruminococcus sp.]|nr:metallophosphoesterase [Ruminococcus sp.]